MRTAWKTDTKIEAKIESIEDLRSEKSSESDDRVSSPRRCRLCAIPNNDMVEIFASSDDTEGNILQMISHCLRIIVQETDTLPKQVCQVCLEELQLCFQFNQIVAEAESQLLALDRESLIMPDEEGKNFQPSTGAGQCGATGHPGIGKTTPVCEKTQNPKPAIAVKKGLTIAETVTSSPDLTRSSVVLVATDTKSRSFCSNDCKEDGRRNSSHDGNNDANLSIDDSDLEIELSDIDPQSTSEYGVSRGTCSGSQANKKNPLEPLHETESEDVKMNAKTSLIHNTSGPHKKVDGLPTGNPVAEAVVDTRKRRYNCIDCTETFLRESSLIEHSKIHTGQRLHTCKYCENKSIWKSHRDVHQQRVHSEERPLRCSLCEKSFKSLDSMMDHRRIHLKHKELAAKRCSICDKAFSCDSAVERHMVIHTGEKQWQCYHCEESFFPKSHLKSHLTMSRCKEQTDIGEQQRHKCNLCVKSFKLEHSLRHHYRLHTGKDLHSCEYCRKNFTTRSIRDRHLIVHTDDRLYKCATCDRSFKYYRNLQRHSADHIDNNPRSQCDYCKKFFVLKRSLLRHFESCQKDARNLTCPLCAESFKAIIARRKGLSSHTSNRT